MGELHKGEVHVWTGSISELGRLGIQSKAISYLSENEKKNYEKYLREADQERFLYGRFVCKTLLSFYSNDRSPNSWILKVTKYGKPYVSCEDLENGIHFNISHSDDLVLCAFSRNSEIGVDVENTLRRVNFFQIAESNFSSSEIDYVFNEDGQKLENKFYRVWTLKEAYSKAKGLGLSMPFQKIQFSLLKFPEIETNIAPEYEERSENWFFKQGLLREKYQFAVAVSQETQPNIKFKNFVP